MGLLSNIKAYINKKMALQHYYISVKEFGAIGDGVADDTSALQRARDFLAAQPNPTKLVFPPGVYKYNASPNWAIQDAVIEALGDVRLRYTGTGVGILLDGSSNVAPVANNVFNTTFKGFKLEATANCPKGVYVHALHHSKVDVRVMGCGSRAFDIQFAVCTEFWCTVSGNEEGFFNGARPYYGLYLSQKTSGLLPAYCTFYNPIIEATTEGTLIKQSLGCSFFGGTMEGCLDSGLIIEAEGGLNKFYSVDFEANASVDIACNGFENEFYAVDTIKQFVMQSTATRNLIQGGSHKSITLEAGSKKNVVSNAKYNRELYDGTTGALTDVGSANRIVDCLNVKGDTIGNRPAATTTITVTASPFTYKNNTGNDELVMIFGGTVTNYQYIHGGTGDQIGTVPLYTRLTPGDSIVLNYTAAPTMKRYTT